MKWRGLEEAKPGLGHQTLKAALDERRALTEQYVPAETQALNRRAAEEIRASGILDRVLPAGTPAPQFQLPDQNGAMVASEELLRAGPLVIVFIRGRWCPFCVATLEAWSQALPQVRSAGASVVAISPQTGHQSYLMHEQHKLQFPLLSDTGNAVARQFGLVYRVPGYQQEIYARTFVNLPFVNGEDSWELPVPAVYAVRNGHIILAMAEPDYTRRAEPLEVVHRLTI